MYVISLKEEQFLVLNLSFSRGHSIPFFSILIIYFGLREKLFDFPSNNIPLGV
eukprot:m.248400 g.248400  ORF g.248400 m.248400 type:complete len:53 (+) comp90498_c0_seq1:68-226(+)